MDEKKKKSAFPTAQELKVKEKAAINEDILFVRKVAMGRYQLIELTIENGEVKNRKILKDDLPFIVMSQFQLHMAKRGFHAITD